MIKNLWVIIPVFNEEGCIEKVINDWLVELNKSKIPFTFCILNDGSKDRTKVILDTVFEGNKNIQIIHKENTGHGQSCIYGYQIAIENNADWIFQIDSDGQCDVKYFSIFTEKAIEQNTSIFGNRVKRDDGRKRMVISKFVSLFVLLATKIWIKDGNVPYRLMPAERLKKIIPHIPKDFYLANILVSVLIKKESKITWLPIHFKNRIAGTPSVKTFSFIKHGLKLYKQLSSSIKNV